MIHLRPFAEPAGGHAASQSPQQNRRLAPAGAAATFREIARILNDRKVATPTGTATGWRSDCFRNGRLRAQKRHQCGLIVAANQQRYASCVTRVGPLSIVTRPRPRSLPPERGRSTRGKKLSPVRQRSGCGLIGQRLRGARSSLDREKLCRRYLYDLAALTAERLT
jgi:hypothetical protein